MAKQSPNAASAFKAVPYKAPAAAPGARQAAAANGNFPVPVYLVMRTDWRFSKRSGRHQQQTTTVVSAFTTLLPAQEAAMIAFEKFVHEYHYAGERSVENRFSWYSWWNGRNKAHYRDVKEIAEDMKTWPSKWKGATAEERYERMVEAMDAVKSRLPSGSIFNVEKASLPPAVRARAVNSTNPVPFRIFVLTENHWSWSKSVDVTTVLGIFTCLNQARAEGVDAYHAYIHSSHQERKRLKWDKTANNAYDKMLKNVIADKVTWEKTSREYGTSFSIDECYCYPRGAYFRHQDEVLPKLDEELNLSKPGGTSYLRSVPPQAQVSAPAPAPAPAATVSQTAPPVGQAARGNIVSPAAAAPVVQKENPYMPVVQSTDQEGPRAYGFIRRTYAVNPEKKKEERGGFQGIEVGAGVGPQRKGILLPTTRGSHTRGSGGERVRFQDRDKEDRRDGGEGSIPLGASIRSNGSTRSGSRHVAFDEDADENERRGRHGEIQGDEDGDVKRRKTWNGPRPEKDEGDVIGECRGQDVAQAWAEARARAQARRAYAQGKDPGDEQEEGSRNEKEYFEGRDIRQGDDIPADTENVVYHRAYPYVARDKWRNEVSARNDELTSEGERADDEISVQTVARRRVYQRRWVDGQGEIHYSSEGYEVEGNDKEVGGACPNDKAGQERDEEALAEVDHEHGCPVTGEACEEEILPEGDEHQPDDHHPMDQSDGEDDEAQSEVDNQPANPLTSEGDEAVSSRKSHYNPFDDSLENEKTEVKSIREGHYNLFDDSLEKEKIEGERIREGHYNPFDVPPETEKREGDDEEVCVEEVVDEPDDSPLVRKPRKTDEKISKYLDDQLKCLFAGEGDEDEIHVRGHGFQSEDPFSVWNSGRNGEPHSRRIHDWPERPHTSASHEVKVSPESCCDQRQVRVPLEKAGVIEAVISEQVEDHRGYCFISVEYEGENHAEGDDPPLIRKPRERKHVRSRRDDRFRREAIRGDVCHQTDHRDYDFTSGGLGSATKAKHDDPFPMRKSGEQKEVRSKGGDRLRGEACRREARNQHDHHDDYFTSGAHKRDDSPPNEKLGERKEKRPKGDDQVRGVSSIREAHHPGDVFADCEADKLKGEEESVGEEIVGRRNEAPHLDLALKRHRACLKADNGSSEEDFGGRRPVGGGFKIPS